MMPTLDQRIRADLDTDRTVLHAGDEWVHESNYAALDIALRAVLDEHPTSVSTAGIYPEKFGEGKCAHCDRSPLIREYRGHLNGRARKQWMHDHVDLHPICPTCHSHTEYEAMQDWPCDTMRAVARALGVTEEDGHA